jgi:hypothetical protein
MNGEPPATDQLRLDWMQGVKPISYEIIVLI